MVSRDQPWVCRFGVGDLPGPHSAVWRVWTAKNAADVYLATRGTAGKLKVSFHESGRRNFSLTTEVERDLRARDRWCNESRHLEQWIGGVKLNPRLSLEFRLWFPTAELRAFEMNRRETEGAIWLPPAEDGRTLEVALFIGTSKPAPDWRPGRDTPGVTLVSEGRIAPGIWAWLVSRSKRGLRLNNPEAAVRIVASMKRNGLTRETLTPGHRCPVWVTLDDGGHGCVEWDLKTLFDVAENM